MKVVSTKDILDRANREMLETLDPFCLPMILATLQANRPADFRFADYSGNEVLDGGIAASLKKSRENFDKHKAALARVFRFFSSETMLLLLLANSRFGTFLWLSTKLRYDDLHDVFVSISKRTIPKRFFVEFDGEVPDFNQWLSWCISGDRTWLAEAGHEQLVTLLVEEAELLTERGLLNSFKHCRPFSFGKGMELQIANEEGAFTPVNAPLEGLNWVRMKTAADSLTMCYGTEQLNFEADFKRLGAISILNDTLRSIRLAEAKNEHVVQFQLPDGFELNAVPKRQKFEYRFELQGKDQ